MAAGDSKVLVVVTTVGNEADARRLASAAVARRHAACAQLERIESHYRWDGAQQADPEWRVAFKTAPAALDALLAWLRSEHPYELPQLLWQPWEASPEYAAWVSRETAGSADG